MARIGETSNGRNDRGRLAAAARIAAGLLAVSLVWYVMIFLIIRFGSVQFYSVREHLLVLEYCGVGYAACLASDKLWPSPAGKGPWRTVAASYVLAGVFGTAVFVAMRLLRGASVDAAGVALNVPFILLTFHSTIAAVWFLERHVQMRVVAAAARVDAERAAAQSELRRLQHQVDPHFLFNNLSILSSLVRTDPDRAELFSQRLTSLYRYLVRHNDAEWVDLDEEVAFAESYVHLMETRFGGAFRVTVDVPPASGFFVIPGLLHEVLNNVVKHNAGSEDRPVDIELRLDGEQLVATNSLRPRRSAEPRSGRGLATLNERYRLQAGESLEWSTYADRFVVKVPLFAGVS